MEDQTKEVKIVIQDFEKNVVKKVILDSIKENEKYQIISLLDKEIMGTNPDLEKRIAGIDKVLKGLKKTLLKYQ